MQKKLMAVAVAGALVAPALAFAQSSTVQLYGRAVIEYGYVDQGDGKNKTDMLQTPGGSAIGLKGEEKLGGGMSAWFQCESSADIRGESTAGFCTRNSALGFKGGFGNVFIGKWDTPFKRAASVGDGAGSEDTGLLGTAFVLFGSSTGTSTSTTGAGGTGSTAPSRDIWKRRQQNSVNYQSPKFGGFSVEAAYSTGNSATSGTDTTVSAKPRVMSIAAHYAAGPAKIAFGYELHKQFAVSGTQELDDKAYVIAGAYKLGKATIGGAFTEQEYEQGAGNELKKKAWTMGVDYNLSGPHSVGGSYAQANDTKGSGAAPAAISSTSPYNVLGSTGAKLFQIYYGHAFSKRTTAKVAYVKLDNDTNAAYTLGGVKASAVAANNKDQNAIVLLVKHNF